VESESDVKRHSNHTALHMAKRQSYMLPVFLIFLNLCAWFLVFQHKSQIEGVAVTTFQRTQLEIVRAVARSAVSYVADEIERRGQGAIPEIEQEILKKFVEPVRLLKNGDAWIYAPEYVVFDLSSDFPDEYRGRSMSEIFAMQVRKGASHYEEMTAAVMSALEGVGWYIWLPEKGKEIAAWTPVKVAGQTWTIGLSTPLPEILEATGAQQQVRTSFVLMGIVSIFSVSFLFWWGLTQKRARKDAEAMANRLRYEQGLADCSQSLLDPKKGLEQAILPLLSASRVNRVYVFENFIEEKDGFCMRPVSEVGTEDICPAGDWAAGQHIPYQGSFSRWREELSRGIPIKGIVSTFPHEERSFLESRGTLSILVLPIFVGRHWQGFIGFEDCRKAYEWNEEDLRLLRTAAEIIGLSMERKRAEEEILKAKKLESVSILAGGIAHDFNNLLSVILGGISLAQTVARPTEPVFRLLAEMEKASLRAKELTQKFITFSTGGMPIKRRGFLKGLVENAASLALSGSNVDCTFSFPDELWPVEVDPDQMSQVISNVILNAREAMPQGGSMEIHAENIEAVQGKSEAGLAVKEGRYAKISIRDHGAGIHGENLARIFDPYFSTKDRGPQKGMGLGLTIAHSIIKKHEGYIHVESERGDGTTVLIYLPASSQEEPAQTEKQESPLPFSGKKRVLVMDDDEMLRDVAREMLEQMGHEAEVARNGEEAVQEYSRAYASGRPIDVVILDLTVKGGMGAKEAVKKLLEIDPCVKAVVSSGYSHDPIMSEFGKHGFSGMLAKPYRMEKLSKALDEVLFSPDSGGKG
jgi:signal transduction histidine kinase/ActR/RegA family two-component response regulator